MQAITTIGLDIAIFQVHGVDAKGNVVLRRQIKRRYVLAFFQKLPPCLVGIEATRQITNAIFVRRPIPIPPSARHD
jgi:transposase